MMIFSVLAGLFFAESATRPARTIELASDPMHPVAVSGLDNDEKAGVDRGRTAQLHKRSV
jgi:hypothetical protein